MKTIALFVSQLASKVYFSPVRVHYKVKLSINKNLIAGLEFKKSKH
jgi:hypothetical protein